MSTENEGAGTPEQPAGHDGAPAADRHAADAARAEHSAGGSGADESRDGARHGTAGPPAGHGGPPPPPPPHAPAASPEPASPAGDGTSPPPPAGPPTASAPAYYSPYGAPQQHAASGTWGAYPPPPPPPRKRRTGLIAALAVVTLLAGGVGGGLGYLVAERGDTSSSSTVTSAPGESNVGERSPESVAGIAEQALPSVVTIQADGDTEGGTGTGFVYDEEGHIVTNNHVVASASRGGTLTATFSDGETYEAELVGGAEGYDVAVLRLSGAEDRNLQPLPLGNSDDVAVGDTTVAIGAPYGLSGTVTSGIVSAKNRPVAATDGQGGRSSFMSALQTDASINPGNSGGPLLNADGAVIGVNSAIQSTSGGLGQPAGSIGLGFAIPVNQADRVARDLIETGEPVYAVIGVSVDMAESGNGAQVSTEGADDAAVVTPGGPADEAGLEPGDVIVRFGDRVIDSGPTLISEIWTYQPGDEVELTYVRGSQETTVEITLDSRVGD
ncbi:trypsin-like peptidase domain-containing protein [Streptomyces sp. ACA25]|uniref:S1C family serine protease n=1 Tax=Streptomyces sp. ACA25 TaxID=3022596 RepID=UPI002307E9F3|nr:trypsin-like peptidase domain-containing protein [Streptomyces sp. ACA25]MDB1086154.1 trypsin-like peptidase domain-containing protein [Streptomyces sp. ACA25]